MTYLYVIRIQHLIGSNFFILKSAEFLLVEKFDTVDKFCAWTGHVVLAGLREDSCVVFVLLFVCIKTHKHSYLHSLVMPGFAPFFCCVLLCCLWFFGGKWGLH